jgi:hypothetical protein
VKHSRAADLIDFLVQDTNSVLAALKKLSA